MGQTLSQGSRSLPGPSPTLRLKSGHRFQAFSLRPLPDMFPFACGSVRPGSDGFRALALASLGLRFEKIKIEEEKHRALQSLWSCDSWLDGGKVHLDGRGGRGSASAPAGGPLPGSGSLLAGPGAAPRAGAPVSPAPHPDSMEGKAQSWPSLKCCVPSGVATDLVKTLATVTATRYELSPLSDLQGRPHGLRAQGSCPGLCAPNGPVLAWMCCYGPTTLPAF